MADETGQVETQRATESEPLPEIDLGEGKKLTSSERKATREVLEETVRQRGLDEERIPLAVEILEAGLIAFLRAPKSGGIKGASSAFEEASKTKMRELVGKDVDKQPTTPEATPETTPSV